MDTKIAEKKCSYHKDVPFSFYCFDDKEFLCSKCFKSHKRHNIEIIDDLKEKSLFYKSLNKLGQSLTDYYIKIQKVLETVKVEIEESLELINKKVDELKQSAPPGMGKDIFSLPFTEYEKISVLNEILKKTLKLSDIMGNLTKEIKANHIYTNFRSINRSVKILDHSKDYPGKPLDVMLGRKNNIDFSLFNGSTNHYIIVDLGEFCFLKSIKIGVDNFDCSLKNFKVKFKNEIGNWEDAGNFVCAQYNVNQNLQEFGINKETQFVRLDFLDNWGVKSGNFILIKFLFFEVGDIL